MGKPKLVKKKQRIRRGGKGRFRNDVTNFKTCDQWKIYHCNIRGFDSKSSSLKPILETVRPNVVTLNETLYMNNKKLNIEGYVTFNRNRKNTNGGGVATSVSQEDSKHTLKVKDGPNNDEYVITRHSQFKVPINIVNIYGETESRTTNNEVEDRWYRVVTELKKIDYRGEHVVLLGDMNKHVGDLINGNHEKVSPGGKLIRELLKTKKYVLINGTNKVKGGPFTRYNPTAPNDDDLKSCIDLIIISKELLKYVDEVIIDKNFNFTPGKPIGRNKMCYPDHYAMLFTMKNIPLSNGKVAPCEKFKMWNLNKDDGWKKYRELTEENENLKKVIQDDAENPTELMNTIDKELTKVKFKAFGKVTVKNDLKTSKELKNLQAEKFKLIKETEDTPMRDSQIDILEEKITAEVLSNQRLKLEKELGKLKDLKNTKGKSAAIFHLKDKVVGRKKIGQEATTMIDHVTSEELVTRGKIKEAALNYCVDLLTNRSPKVGFEEDVRLKDMIHEARMNEVVDDDGDARLSIEVFENSLKELEKKNKEKYAFILKSGNDYKQALYKLFSLVWNAEEKPDQWRNTLIVQLFKGKGEKNEFGNQRNIHTKMETPKMFGHMVMSQAKGKIIEKMSKFQIGTKNGHRAQEHLFSLKSIIAFYLSHDFPILIQLYDISKFFDRESLRDGMNSIYNCGIKGKLYRLIYGMNKDTRIRVRTAVGESEEKETGENIGQGTLEGATISAANIDYTVNMFFQSSMDELSYGGERIQPLLFQDDISRLSTSVRGAQTGNTRMESVMETKLLDFNLEKSCVIVMGSRKQQKEIKEQLEQTPLTLCGKSMVNVQMEKYLGDMLCTAGLSESVHATVIKRKGQVISSILDTKAVIEDCRSNVVGGIVSGLNIWELAILPYLLNNSETWTELSKKTIDELDDLQCMFFRYLLATPRTCPIPSLLWETGGIQMNYRIIQKKLVFYHHLINLPPNSLAYQIASTQVSLSYPGLMMECQELREEYNLPDGKSCSKIQWKKIVRNKIKEQNETNLLSIVQQKYKKLDYNVLSKETCDVKSYMKTLNLPEARMKFAIRTKMTRTVQMNYKGDPGYTKNHWKCKDCFTPDTQEHVIRCPSYQHLRTGKDLSSDKDLVQYFGNVLRLRDKLDDERIPKK